MGRRRFTVLLPAFWASPAASCTRPIHFPAAGLAEPARQAGAHRAWDTTGDGRGDDLTAKLKDKSAADRLRREIAMRIKALAVP